LPQILKPGLYIRSRIRGVALISANANTWGGRRRVYCGESGESCGTRDPKKKLALKLYFNHSYSHFIYPHIYFPWHLFSLQCLALAFIDLVEPSDLLLRCPSDHQHWVCVGQSFYLI